MGFMLRKATLNPGLPSRAAGTLLEGRRGGMIEPTRSAADRPHYGATNSGIHRFGVNSHVSRRLAQTFTPDSAPRG